MVQTIVTKLLADNIAATAVVYLDTANYSDVYLTFIGASTPNWAVKIYQGKDGATFTANGTSLSTITASNPLTTQYCLNTSTNAGVDGATGITVNSTTPIRLRVNDFFNAQIGILLTRTAGNITVLAECITRSV